MNLYNDTQDANAHGSATSVFAIHHKATGTKLLGHYNSERGDSGLKVYDVSNPSSTKHIGTFGTTKALHTHLDKYKPGVTSKDYEYQVGTKDASGVEKHKLGHSSWNKDDANQNAGRSDRWGYRANKSTGLSGDTVRRYFAGKPAKTINNFHDKMQKSLGAAIGKLQIHASDPSGSHAVGSDINKHLDDVIAHANSLKKMASNVSSSYGGLTKDRYTRDEYKDALATVKGKSKY